MKNAPTPDCGESVPNKREYTPGTLPKRPNTVRAEVLAALLDGDDLTGMDSVFAQNTTRLSAVVCALEKDYGWPIQRHDIAVHTKDGRSVWIVGYYLHRATIDAAVKRGARPWIEAVKVARAKTETTGPQVETGYRPAQVHPQATASAGPAPALAVEWTMNRPGFAQFYPGHPSAGVPNEQDRARSALRHIDPDCPYDEWVRIGMAAQAAGLAFEDFHNWSAAAGNYAGEHDCRTKWKSFDAHGAVTAATLFKAARDQGWHDPTLGANHTMNMPVAKQKLIPTKPATSTESPKAVHVWELCDPAPAGHPYIVKKGGTPSALRVYPATAPELIIRDKDGPHSVAGWLVVPCLADGRLQTLQLISCDGRKLNLPGASFHDGFFMVGQINAADVIYTAEGLGQAWAIHAATGAAAVVTFGAGRMAAVAAALRTLKPAARLVLVPDRGKENQAQAISAKVNCGWCELPAHKPINYDANDYLLEDGAAALAQLVQAPKTTPMRFRLLSGRDLSALPPLRWMVRGILPLDGLAALYGPSGVGKSFLVLDIAAAVAGGQHDWFGRRVTQRPVTYCALEGESGMGKRVAAWVKHHNKPVPETLRFMAQPFDLLASGDVIDLAQAVQAAGGAGGLVIIDTLNRAAPGADENSSVDMGNLIAAAKRLQTSPADWSCWCITLAKTRARACAGIRACTPRSTARSKSAGPTAAGNGASRSRKMMKRDRCTPSGWRW